MAEVWEGEGLFFGSCIFKSHIHKVMQFKMALLAKSALTLYVKIDFLCKNSCRKFYIYKFDKYTIKLYKHVEL